jgi:hypothetical protein
MPHGADRNVCLFPKVTGQLEVLTALLEGLTALFVFQSGAG